MSAEPSEEKRLLDWLYATQLYGVKLGLENTVRLLKTLDLPAKGQKFIHVAGTNGKGSVCAFTHSLMNAMGVNAGLFTSPHLIQFRERIRDSRGMIPKSDFVKLLKELKQTVADWDPHPTFFELSFALALIWFAQQKLEWAVLETGMGGRLDATNAIEPVVTVITSVSMDHQAILGNTLAAIAGEKAGIIKPGVPLISLKQNPQAMEVLSRTARERGAPFNIVTTPVRGYELGLAGHHQLWNAAMAVAALKAAGFKLTETVLNPGLKNVAWPARFQTLQSDSNMILDGAHNVDAAETLVRTWQHKFPKQKATIVFGAASNKDIRMVVRALQPVAARWCFTGFDSPRAAKPAHVCEMHHAIYGDTFPATVHENPSEALAEAKKHKEPILITGSLYLAGEVLALTDGKRGLFEPSDQ
jgi:dihydrofolate synthase / folylpolyglutamate synthase